MNERIRQLEDQASLYASRQTTDPDEWEFIFRKKFAELIVSECLDIVDIEVPGMIGVHAMKKISEHFGVES